MMFRRSHTKEVIEETLSEWQTEISPTTSAPCAEMGIDPDSIRDNPAIRTLISRTRASPGN